MNIQQINIGQYPNDGSGDDLRTAFEKIISNFNEIEANVVLSVENLGTGIPLVLENVIDNKLQVRTIRSGNDNLAIGFDSTELILTVSDIYLDEIIDVRSINPIEKQVLSWTGDIWEPVNLNSSYLTDFSIINPGIGDSLVWNGSQWVAEFIEPVAGVTKIIAGNNITISPESGEGEVTINSNGGGVPDGFDFGNISNPSNILELLIQITPVDFGTIQIPGSLNLDLGFIEGIPAPTYSLSSSVSQVLEGGSFTITLTTSNLPNGTLVPYVITGVNSSDINNQSLTGNFIVVNNLASITIQTTLDGISEGTEILTLTLVGIIPTTSISISILEISIPIIDGGSPDTISFESIANGGLPTDEIFNNVLDGGSVVFVQFLDATLNGGTPFDTEFSTIVDGSAPSTPVSVILDGGIVT